jgi:hypothetical protein
LINMSTNLGQGVLLKVSSNLGWREFFFHELQPSSLHIIWTILILKSYNNWKLHAIPK